MIGVAGALLGGWLATKLFHVVTLHGFFNVSTWLTAIAGSVVLLLAYHLVTSRGSTGLTRRRTGLGAPVTGLIRQADTEALAWRLRPSRGLARCPIGRPGAFAGR